ncbi:MAG: hypothetical protein EOP83_15665 [Verrucomicrobiaceae bacterium]|nr:MAG: hypothetical protein EOP83_15665 [Verrucomicrobiaceae bacterium]
MSTLTALADALKIPVPSPAVKPPKKSLAEITKLYQSTGVNVMSVVDEGDHHVLTLELRVPKAA